MAKKTTVLTEADKLTSQTRRSEYGHPQEDFERVAMIWSAILGYEVTPHQVVLCMAGLKLSRASYSLKRDTIVDIAGYARVLELLDE